MSAAQLRIANLLQSSLQGVRQEKREREEKEPLFKTETASRKLYSELSSLQEASESLRSKTARLHELVVRETTSQLLSSGKSSADAYFALGVMSHARRELTAAVEMYEKALEIDKDHVPSLAFCAVAIIYLRGSDAIHAGHFDGTVSGGTAGMVDSSLGFLVRQVRRMLNGELSLVSLAQYDAGWFRDDSLLIGSFGKLDQEVLANLSPEMAHEILPEILLDRSLQLARYHVDVLWAVGLLHGYRGRIVEAEAFWTVALQTNPKHVGCLHALARLDVMRGDAPAARDKERSAYMDVLRSRGATGVHTITTEPDSTLDITVNPNPIEGRTSAKSQATGAQGGLGGARPPSEDNDLRLRFAHKDFALRGVGKFTAKGATRWVQSNGVLIRTGGAGSELGAAAIVERSGVVCCYAVACRLMGASTDGERACAWALPLSGQKDQAVSLTDQWLKGTLGEEEWVANTEEYFLVSLPLGPPPIPDASTNEVPMEPLVSHPKPWRNESWINPGSFPT